MDLLAQHDATERRNGSWTRPRTLIGNGPFVLTEWSPNKVIVVEKSTTYWDRAHVHLERIAFHPVENADTEEKMFRAGQLHKSYNLPVTKLDAWRRDHPAALRLEPEQRNRIVVVNVKRPPFTDARVRRALALALDRDQLARAVGANRPPARSFAPPDGTEFQAIPQYEDDIGTARALLAEAGFPDGKGFKPFEVLFPNRGNARLTMEIVQEMWRRNLGLAASLNQQEWSVYIDSENNGQYDVAYDGWNMSHPHLFFELNRTGNPMSRYLWSDPDYDAALHEAARAATSAARNTVYARMEAILAREMPAIPLHFEVQTFLMHPAVHGWHGNLPNNHPWKSVSLE
jgi:oligopeptide transport system substrate-binding protein